MMRTNSLYWILIGVGAFLLLSGIILGFVGAEVLNIPFVRMDLVPIAIGFCGVLLIVSVGSALIHEKYKTKEQQIIENDERNITILRKAKSKTYDLMSVLFGFGLLTLALLGYMNKVSFFSIAGLYIISQLYFRYQYLSYQKRL